MMRATVAVLLLTLAACGDDQGPKIPEMDGRWEGTSAGIVFDLTLNETEDGNVNGSGSMSGSGGALSLTVEGVHSYPNVSLTASAQGYEDVNFTGEFTDDDTVRGELNGSGFRDNSLTLRRQ